MEMEMDLFKPRGYIASLEVVSSYIEYMVIPILWISGSGSRLMVEVGKK